MLYHLTKFYIKIALHLFYKDIKVTYKTPIPNDKAILFVANHQNAMLDPLVIGTTQKTSLYFLARAAAFKHKIGAYLLNKIHAIAIYRVRDGVDSKKKNKAVFARVLSLLNKNKTILIFPEGSHSMKRQIRPLRYGFTQIVFDYLQANPNKEFLIIPVGLNYTNTIHFGASVHVIYGKPIRVNELVSFTDLAKTKALLIQTVTESLQAITVHIPDTNYDVIHHKISADAFLKPEETNKKISKNTLEKALSKKVKPNLFYRLMQINSIFPLLIWYWLKPKIAQKEFLSTFKFALGITVFPLFYLLQSLLINHFLGCFWALVYLLFSVVLVIISKHKKN